MQPQSSGGPNSVQSPLNGSEQSNLLPHSPQAQVSNTTTSPGDVTLNLNPQGNTTNRNDNNKAEAKPQKRKTLLNQDKWPIIFWGTSDLLGLITTIVAGVSVLALLITLIILLAYHFGEKETDLTSTAGALNYMSFNLNADPIIRLSLSINGKCPSGTDKTYLGTWPGTSDGCNCPVIGMKAEKCADKQKSVCSDVSSIDSAQLFRWEDSFLCVRRAKINSEYMKAVNCSEGFKSCCQDADPSKCSVGICMRKDLDCPLTAINIQTTGAQEDFLDTDKYISSSRDPTGNAIVDITISNNDVPCFSMNQTVEGKGDYVLLNTHPGCSAYGKDEFSKKIDSSPQTDVINFNGLSKDILELPGYKPITDSTTSYLSARTRITVANHDECLGLNTKIMDDASAAALNLNKYINGTSIAAIAVHGLLIILLCASFGFAVMQEKSWIQALYGKTSGLWLAVYVLMMFIELCVYIVMTALVKSSRSVLVDAQDYLGHLSELGCFPTGTPKEVIQDCHSIAGTVSAKLNGFAVALLVLALVTYVPIVAVIVYKNVFKR